MYTSKTVAESWEQRLHARFVPGHFMYTLAGKRRRVPEDRARRTRGQSSGENCTSLCRASLVQAPGARFAVDRPGSGHGGCQRPTTLSPATTARRLSPVPSRRRIALQARRVRPAARRRGRRSCWSRARSPVTDSLRQRPRPLCVHRALD